MNNYLASRVAAASLLSLACSLAVAEGAARLEAKSELFELVARLEGGHLSILIDRYASNEPLLKAAVEVEAGALKAKASFHAEQGDYVVEDPALLKLLGTPGEHPLLITVVAGDEADLLEGVLRSVAAAPAPAPAHAAPGSPRWLPTWVLGLAAALLALLAWAWRRKLKLAGESA
jgi:hypothetical protein